MQITLELRDAGLKVPRGLCKPTLFSAWVARMLGAPVLVRKTSRVSFPKTAVESHQACSDLQATNNSFV